MRNYVLLLFTVLAFSSCNINKNILFKSPTDYTYDSLPDTTDESYTISPNDLIDFRFYTADGYMLVEGSFSGELNINNQTTNNNNRLNYLVDKDGTIKLPVIGRINLEGLTVREAEELLERLYSELYNDPFVVLTVSNSRVIVSPGEGGSARVITLTNTNTTLMEAIGLAGGISNRGNASKIKLIRTEKESQKRKVYLIDLSTIEGVDEADIIVQANDIIYVEPMPQVAQELATELAPYVTLLTSLVLVISIFNLNQ